MKIFTFILLSFIFTVCQYSDVEHLDLPEGVDGFKLREGAVFYSDISLSAPLEKKPWVPFTESVPIRKYYRLRYAHRKVIEAVSGGTVYFLDESDIYLNYKSCKKYSDIPVTKRENLKGLIFRSKLPDTGPYIGKTLERSSARKGSYGYQSYIFMEGNEMYNVQTLYKTVAFCEGNSPVNQVLDFVAEPYSESSGFKEIANVCSPAKREIQELDQFSFIGDGTYDAAAFYKVVKAWQIDLDELKLKPVNPDVPKCFNECAGGGCR